MIDPDQDNARELDALIRSSFRDPLPYGFAERVAHLAMQRREDVWDLILRLWPRAGVVAGAVGLVLLAFGLVGGDPDIFEAVREYGALKEFFPLQ